MKRKLRGKKEKGATKWFYYNIANSPFMMKVMFTNKQEPNTHICEETFFFFRWDSREHANCFGITAEVTDVFDV